MQRFIKKRLSIKLNHERIIVVTFSFSFMYCSLKKIIMKKILMLATAALLISGASFAQDKKGDKSCCKKGSSSCCKDKSDKSTVKSKALTAKAKTAKI